MTSRESELLRSAERPRALTDVERTRILERLATTNAPVADSRDDLSELQYFGSTPRSPRRATLRLAVAAVAAVAAVSLLFMIVSIREVTKPETAIPVAPLPDATLPSPRSLPQPFCAESVEPVASALQRWRSVENWAWARGTPDVGQLVEAALESAEDLEDRSLAAEASRALDRLGADLAVAEAASSDRDAIAPTVAAIDSALDSLITIAGSLTPPCDVEQLANS